MFIVHIEPPSHSLQGDQLYRTVQPCAALAEREDVYVMSGHWLSRAVRQAAQQADVLVLCQAVDVDMLPLCLMRQTMRLPTVFEINDDFTSPPPAIAAARFCQNPIMLGLSLQLAALCQARQFSSPTLQARFVDLGTPWAIFENQLDHLGPLPVKRADRTYIGYGGSVGHLDDARALAEPLLRVLKRFPEAHFVSMVHPAVRASFAALPAGRCTHLEPGDMQAYRAFLHKLHIGLAPLLPSAFNRGRSDVKYLEYTCYGAATVCSAMPPYHHVRHGKTGWVCDTVSDFETGVLRLLHDPDLRQTLVQGARQQVQRGRLEAQHAASRHDFLSSLCKVPEQSSHDRFAACLVAHGAAHTRVSERYARLSLAESEVALLEVLQHGGDAAAALRAAPTHYAAHLYAGQRHPSAPAARAALKEARRLAPGSLAVLQALGKNLHSLGQTQAALAAYNQTIKLAPNWAPGHEAVGLVKLLAGERQAAERNFRAALRANAFYRPPALRLATLAAQAGDVAAASGYLTDAPALLPRTPDETAMLASLQAIPTPGTGAHHEGAV